MLLKKYLFFFLCLFFLPTAVGAYHQMSDAHKVFVDDVHQIIEQKIEQNVYSRDMASDVISSLIHKYKKNHTYATIFQALLDKLNPLLEVPTETTNNSTAHRPSNAKTSDYSSFPQAQNQTITNAVPAPSKPRANNVSWIFWNNDNNNDYINLYQSSLSIAGEVPAEITAIEVIWDGDMDSYFLKTYIPWSKKFTYNIDERFENIREGENKYLIRAFASNNQIFERIMYLTYYPADNKNISAVELSQGNYDALPYSDLCKSPYKVNIAQNEFRIHSTPNLQRLQTYDLQDFTIEVTSLEQYSNTLRIRKNGTQTNAVAISVWCADFSWLTVKRLDADLRLLQTSGWHEGEPMEYLYIPSQKKIIDVFEDIIKKDTSVAPYIFYSLELEGDEIILREYPYCCDTVENPGGYEKIIINKQSLTITSRKSLYSRLQAPNWLTSSTTILSPQGTYYWTDNNDNNIFSFTTQVVDANGNPSQRGNHQTLVFYHDGESYTVLDVDTFSSNSSYINQATMTYLQMRESYHQFTILAETYTDAQGKKYIKFLEFMK